MWSARDRGDPGIGSVAPAASPSKIPPVLFGRAVRVPAVGMIGAARCRR
ncbi:MAG: hypothetical protein AVDCRST_MAG49-3098 [uncultured Thermomicrobiales bacterium]|uniref:Uncharacterized protein n=1 Tax=uncultured Thermomicrobiales bacterium TaxID=1645740 RepID=A0A6J4V799_9BACT|nr:MAG: hypothetical protein AVDCRST_MAG49-3098 [uncultured Thermomicrobiales bacterium]